MKVIRETVQFYAERPTAVSLGKFDGLHKGHQLLLNRVLGKKQEGLDALIFTFDFGARASLMLPWERREMLEQQGIDVLVECPFVPEISGMEAEDFVEEILVKRLHAKYLAVGTDFRFGFQRKGDYHLLQEMGKKLDFQVDVVEKACLGEREISSTYIREELEKGNIELVNQMLGYAYSVTGKVLHGRKIGRTLGLPTINLSPEADKLLPPNGVYATKTYIDGNVFAGITNVGYKPTVGGETKKGVETYLFDFNQDLYEKEVTVVFAAFARAERKFASLEVLKQQIEQDVCWGKNYFSGKASADMTVEGK